MLSRRSERVATAGRLLVRAPWPLMAVVAAVILLAASAGPTPLSAPKPGAYTDLSLYVDVTARVQAGEDYYAAAASLQRAHHYPVKPAVTIREPTEAWLLAGLGSDLLRRAAILVLAVFATEAMRRALAAAGLGLSARLFGMMLAAQGFIYAAAPTGPYVHEIWAALLVTSSLAVWRPGRYGASVVLAAMACLFREIAAPVLLVMAICAAADRRWREVSAWCGAAVVFGLLAAAHLWFAGRQALPTDLSSSGWVEVGGWRFVLATARRNALLILLPNVAVSVAVSLALLGYTRAGGPWGRRLAAVTFAFVGLFWFVGRPDNSYWGILYCPILLLGLVYSPRAARALIPQDWRLAFRLSPAPSAGLSPSSGSISHLAPEPVHQVGALAAGGVAPESTPSAS